jgi:hypothetical protein
VEIVVGVPKEPPSSDETKIMYFIHFRFLGVRPRETKQTRPRVRERQSNLVRVVGIGCDER